MSHWRFSRIASFKNAFSGIWYNLTHGPNFLIQSIFALAVIIAGLILPIRMSQWAMLIISIGAVLSAEAFNTAIEKICDRFLNAEDEMIRIVKDSAAAAVLIISISAALIGVLVFLPFILDFLRDII